MSFFSPHKLAKKRAQNERRDERQIKAPPSLPSLPSSEAGSPLTGKLLCSQNGALLGAGDSAESKRPVQRGASVQSTTRASSTGPTIGVEGKGGEGIKGGKVKLRRKKS